MKDLWRWKLGRQGTGYEIFTLIYSKALRLDAYLIKYSQGASIPAHTDPVATDLSHYRLNVELWPAKEGGELVCAKSLFRLGPINFFRPDKVIHAVTEVKKGTRYVLSIGWVRKKAK